MYQKTSIQRE